MITKTIPQSQSATELLPIIGAALLGLAIIFIVGHVQATTLHGAAHDVRHATGFPCH